MDDVWQEAYGIAAFDGSSDPDEDGRINLVEGINWSDPFVEDSGLGFVMITDSNGDGMDDEWQNRYQITSAQALLDSDGDGRKNIEEGIVFSDPRAADLPYRNPGVYSNAPVAGPNSFTMSMSKTVVSQRYQWQTSADLLQWEDVVDSVFWGNGLSRTDTMSIAPGTPRQFFRYRVSSPDSDGDTVSDWHELFVLHTDPSKWDSDNDGFSDYEEAGQGSDPNNAASRPSLNPIGPIGNNSPFQLAYIGWKGVVTGSNGGSWQPGQQIPGGIHWKGHLQPQHYVLSDPNSPPQIADNGPEWIGDIPSEQPWLSEHTAPTPGYFPPDYLMHSENMENVVFNAEGTFVSAQKITITTAQPSGISVGNPAVENVTDASTYEAFLNNPNHVTYELPSNNIWQIGSVSSDQDPWQSGPEVYYPPSRYYVSPHAETGQPNFYQYQYSPQAGIPHPAPVTFTGDQYINNDPVTAQLSNPGGIIPYPLYNVPKSGGLLAIATSSYAEGTTIFDNKDHTQVTMTESYGQYHKGQVKVQWMPGWPLTAAGRKAWMSQYLLAIIETKDGVETVKSIEPLAQAINQTKTLDPGVPSAANTNTIVEMRLLPIDFEDEAESSGLDKLSPEKWLMVPQDEDNRAYILNGSGFDIKVVPGGLNYISPDRTTITSNREFTTFGEGGTLGDGEGLAFGKGGVFTTDAVLNFSVKQRREIKVAVHPITLISANGSTIKTPQNTPSQAAIQDFLNKTFGPQVNVFCSVSLTAGASVNWDAGVGVGGSVNGFEDRHFQILNPGLGFSDEEDAVITAINDPTADVNVYFIAAEPLTQSAGGVWLTNVNGSENSPVLGFAGKASKTNNGVIYVWDFPRGSDDPSHVWAIAHEVGHFIGDLMHSTIAVDSNPSYLRGTDNELRLMTGKEGSKRATNPRMLVKGEWDKFDEYFTAP
ncbi:hypothetical protein BH11VER1_BH11VER1_41810 [soil metagenome]